MNIGVGHEEGLSTLSKGQIIRQRAVGGITSRTESAQRIQDEPGTLRSVTNIDVTPRTLVLDIWRSPLKQVLLWEGVTP